MQPLSLIWKQGKSVHFFKLFAATFNFNWQQHTKFFTPKFHNVLAFSFFLIFFVGISERGWGQTTIYSQNFGTGTTFPTGWSAASSTTWTIINTQNSNGYSGASGGSNASSSSSSEARTITYSNNLSTVGYTNITISWAARRAYTNSVICQWSINGTTWNNLTFTDVPNNSTWAWVNGGTRIALPVEAGNVANLRIRWTYDSDGTGGRYRIDDFSVNGTIYCIPTYTTGTVEGDYIARVQLGDINNVTVGSASPYYSYYSSLSTDLTLSNSYTITLRSGTYQSSNNISVWIDYNQNGTFETSEKLGNVTLLSNSNGTINFTVPSGAIIGITRMRVRETWNESNMDPCTGYIYGETEDYNINIISACTGPTVLSYTTPSPSYCNGIAITTNSATLTTTGTPAPIFSVSPALPDGLSLNTSTGAITGTPTVNIAATDYTVTASNTCGSTSSVVNITVNPTPNMSSADTKTICSGEAVALNLTSDIASTYSWIATDNANVTGESITSQTSATISDVLVNTTTSVQTVTYTVTPTSTTGTCLGTVQTVTIIISALPSAPTTTSTQICIGSTATLSASGAISGQIYKWYNAVSGGALLKTSTSNTDNTFTTPVLSVTTNYWVTIQNATGCESERTQVTATFPAVSTNSQTASGNNEWIGHVYDGTNFTNYYGTYTESQSFLQVFGGNTFCFGINSSLGNRTIYTETFSVRYRMTTSLSGCYIVNLRADDGIRLFVDGVKIFDRWTDQAPRDYNNVLLPLNSNSQLIYEYYENGGQNEVAFRNLYKIENNVLTGGTDQTICAGNSATQISAANLTANNVALPAGLTTTWQWYYSNSSTTSGTIITGATSQNYTPSGYPFNSPGTYYVYRVATVSSSNAANGNNWGATSPVSCSFESDRAFIKVDPASVGGWISYVDPICEGSSVTLTLNGNTGNVTRWERRLGTTGGWTTISGISTTLTDTPPSGGSWQYRAVVQSGVCAVAYSNPLTITVNPTVSITLGADPVICQTTTTASLAYSATTGSPGGWSLTFDAVAISSGFSSPQTGTLSPAPGTITVNVPHAVAAGTYNANLKVFTYSPVCTSVDYPVTITVNASSPALVVITGNNNVCAGTLVTYTATPTNGGTSPGYQWKVNGINVGGNSTYAYTPVDGDIVTCIMTSNSTCATGSPVTSNEITMSVNPLPTATLSGTTTICEGSSATLSVTFTGTGPWEVTTQRNGGENVTVTNINVNPYTYNVSAAGTYTISAFNDDLCDGTFSGSATVTVNPLPSATVSSTNSPICAEEDAIFSLSGTSGAIVTYNINGGSDTTATLTGGTATVTITAATANLTLNLVSVAEGSCSQTLGTSSTITVNPLPEIGSFINNE